MRHRRRLRSRGGDEAPRDFADLFAERAPGLRRTAYLLCGDWQRAEDLVQTTFAKVFAARRRVDDPVALPAYLRQTLTHTYIDESRRRWRGERPSGAVGEPSVDATGWAGRSRGIGGAHGSGGDDGRSTSSSAGASSSEAGAAGPEDRLVLLAALAQLPPRQRACLVLRFYEDCSVSDTAALLGVTEGTVKSNTARGLDHLRRLLGDLEPEVASIPGREK